MPTEVEVTWACDALVAVTASGGGVARLNGQMVDAPHLETCAPHS